MEDAQIVDTRLRPLLMNPGILGGQKNQVIVLMGPTGSGKSRFIEMILGDESLGISRDQLESCTKDITAYQMVQVESSGREREDLGRGTRIYVLDTPGFADTEMSELEIVKMLHEWLRKHHFNHVVIMLYLCPITDTRIPGSKRKTIDMLKEMTRVNGENPGAVSIVTTMWDTLWTERAKAAAEVRFAQLRDDIWKDLLDSGGQMARFLNTRTSALKVIGEALVHHADHEFLYPALTVDPKETIRDETYAPQLYQELLTRIQNVQDRKQILELDLAQPDTQANEELKSITESRLQHTNQLLIKFENQLIDFGRPPSEFKHAASLRHDLMHKYGRRRGIRAKIKHWFFKRFSIFKRQ